MKNKEYWDKQASTHKESYKASWEDIFMIKLERRFLKKELDKLEKNSRIFDLGCGNGHSTIILHKKNRMTIGVDISIELITQARNISNYKSGLLFYCEDITKLEIGKGRADIIYTTRALINLKDWYTQKKVISNCYKALKKGGKLILLEAFKEPLINLNFLRVSQGLDLLHERKINTYLHKSKLEDFLNEHNIKFKCFEYSSLYYLGSRFIRESITNKKIFKSYINPINKLFFELEKKFDIKNYGIQQAYIIYK